MRDGSKHTTARFRRRPFNWLLLAATEAAAAPGAEAEECTVLVDAGSGSFEEMNKKLDEDCEPTGDLKS